MTEITALFSIPGFAALTIACGIVFSLREVVAFKRVLGLKYLLTPLITFLIMIIAINSAGRGITAFPLLVVCAIGLSLIGDAMLMIEEMNLFTHGLIFFLSAHVVYVFAFSLGYSWQPWNLAIVIVLGICYLAYNILVKSKQVAVYSAVLMLMLFFAFTSFNNGPTVRSIVLSAAAVLFAFSDGLLGINTFVRRIPNSTVYTWALYAPAQFLFAASCYL